MRNTNKNETENASQLRNINRNIRRKNQDTREKNKSFAESKFMEKVNKLVKIIDLKRFGIVFAAVLLVVTTVAIINPVIGKAHYVEAYEVYINEKSIGAMEDVTGLESTVNSIYSEYEQYCGMEVSRDVALTYLPVNIDEQYLCPSEYYEQIIRDNLDLDVVAWVIYVNNNPALALKKRDDAQWVLEQLLSPYENYDADIERFDIGFLENVEIKSESISYEKVQDKETALRIMQYGDDIEVQKHKVVSGETLSSICKSYGLKLSDIYKANPSLTDDGKIYKGDILIVTKINNIVNVKYTEYVEREEEMPYDTIIIEDDSMYVTQSRVRQEGVVGVRSIKANVVYINGSESSYEIIFAEEPSVLPVDKILVKGTKEVPYVYTLATQGRMSFPLSSYTITSYFGERNTGIEGASTFHNGIDLAAPYGTPIYASEDGQVTFAGSSSGYGLLVKISHGGGVETRYGHCSTLLVKSGQYVEKGEIIALVGSTGVSSGNHVHFEVRVNGTPVDPLG